MAEMIVEWNWVDDNGNPLSLPRDDPSVVDWLTMDEIMAIVNATRPMFRMQPNEEERTKN
jgi:hypothetical protein